MQVLCGLALGLLLILKPVFDNIEDLGQNLRKGELRRKYLDYMLTLWSLLSSQVAKNLSGQ